MSSRKNTSRKNYRLQWGSKYVFKRSDKLSQASLILTTLAPSALASFENQKITKFRIGGVQFMKLLLESSRKELPCPFLTRTTSNNDFVSQGVALGAERSDPSKKKKNKLQKSGFCEHKKSEEFLSLKNSEELRKKKHQETFNNQAPRPKTYPKNLHTKVLSNPNICFPTTPFVPNFRRRSAIFLRRSAKGSSSPAWKKVVLASSTWGIGTSRLDYLNKLGKTAGKSRKRCSFSFKKDII